MLGPDPRNSKNDRVFIIYRAWGPTFNPSDVELHTYKTWWFMRSPEAGERQDQRDHFRALGIPVLFIHGENDYAVDGDEPRELKRILNESGNNEVELKFIPDARHDCMENPGVTTAVLIEWLSNIS